MTRFQGSTSRLPSLSALSVTVPPPQGLSAPKGRPTFITARGATACSLFALAGVLSASPAAAFAGGAGVIDELVVTAQKREQRTQDIPLSIAAVRGDAIEATGLQSLQDFGNTIAGVNTASGNPGQMRLTIRGAGDLSGSNQGASVNGYYIDETVISYVPGYMPEVGIFDVARIEVLRGPQGTLFGDGSEGGTLRVITRKPEATHYFGRYRLTGYDTKGGDMGFGAEAKVNVPLQKDVLAASLTASYRDLPGWIDVPDLKRKDTNGSKLADARLAVRYTPRAGLVVDGSYLYSRSKIFDFLATSPGVLDPRTAGKAFGAGPVGALSPARAELNVAALTVSYDLPFATLVAASGWTRATNNSTRDLTAALPIAFPPPFVPGADAKFIYDVKSRAVSQEIRLVSRGDSRLDWTVGGYVKHETRSVGEGFTFTVPAIRTVDSPRSESEQTGTAWAVFADVDYQLNDRLSAQAGLRWFTDNKDFSVVQVRGSGFPLGFPPAGNVQAGQDSSTAASPKIGMTYRLRDRTLVYAKYSQGFRSGGSNTVPVATYRYAESQYGPEKLDAYELGLKTALAAGWSLNASVYHNDWRDLQLPFRTTDGVFSYVRNAGTASSDGAEVEAVGRVGEHLQVNLAYAYTNARVDGDVRDLLGHVIARAGSRIPLTSRNKITVSGSYTQPLSAKLNAVVDARYRWASANFTDPSNDAAFRNDASSQLFVGVGVEGAWGQLRLYVDNVLNAQDSIARFPPAGPPAYVFTNYSRPRTVGVELRGAW